MGAHILVKYTFPASERKCVDVSYLWPPQGFSDEQPQHPCSQSKRLSRLPGNYTQRSHVQQKPLNAVQTSSKTFHITPPLSVCNGVTAESAKVATQLKLMFCFVFLVLFCSIISFYACCFYQIFI